MRKFIPHAGAALAAALLLSACNSQPENISSGSTDDMANEVAAAKPVELPPALAASKSYRCKDNSVVFIDWFAGDKMANLRAKKDDMPTVLKSEEAGKGLSAEGGYALDGTASAATVELTQPGKGKQSCKA